VAAPAPAGTVVQVPVWVRDVALTPLGRDRAPGDRIQGFAVKALFDPAVVQSATFSRAGITAGLTAIFESNTPSPGAQAWLVAFDEGSDLVPFTLDAAAPGDQVGTLSLTLRATAPVGPMPLVLDPVSELSNQAGTVAQNQGGGSLELADGGLEVLSNAALHVQATVLSSSDIVVGWTDPGQNETGFRLETSADGVVWGPLATLGPDDTSFPHGGLPAATLHYYRVVTLVPADSHVSNVAAASTFPAAAAKVCVERLSTARGFARFPAAAWNGSSWAVAWSAREAGFQDDVWFQRFASTTLAPLGAPARLSTGDASNFVGPVVTWNGTHHGVLWGELLPGAPGEAFAATTFFALLDAAGSVVRAPVRVAADGISHP
jgi:hypothetical protein